MDRNNKTPMWLAVFSAVIMLIVFMVFVGGQSGVDSANIVNESIIEEDLAAIGIAANDECLTYDSASQGFDWDACAAGGGVHPVVLETDTIGTLDISNSTNLSASLGAILTGDVITTSLGTSVTSAEISGVLDISSQTNLTASSGAILTGDDISTTLGTSVDISSETNLTASSGAVLTGDDISTTLGTSVDISGETNLTASSGAILTGDNITTNLGTTIDTTEIDLDTILAVDIAAGGVATSEILDGTILEADLNAIDAAADGEVLTFNAAGSNFEWEAGGGAHLSEGRISVGGTDNYNLPGIGLFQSSTEAHSSNVLFFFPIVVSTTITLDRIASEVTGAGSGGATARLGIYEADIDWQPGDLVVDAGTIAIDTTGLKAITISEVLTEGRYLLAYVGDATATLREIRGTFLGHGINAGSASTIITGLRITGQGAEHTAFSDPGVLWTIIDGSASTPFKYQVYVRISTP